MSNINYELSLWREYPGSKNIQEEKTDIIAATGMLNAGRAQNIKLKKEYNGKLTLTFEVPKKFFDEIEGKNIVNPLVKKVIDHSKIKLWRDELWWNPFSIYKGINQDNECSIFEGAWEQGRWYEFVVVERSEKRSKKQMVYSYTCESLFITELSRTGYNLEFVPDTDIMSANGMGTAHELAERIVEGTDWRYIKTEVFPDYKEEFNAITGETVKTKVSTDQIEYAKGLERYVYCFKVVLNGEVSKLNKALDMISESIIIEAEKLGVTLVREEDFGFTKGIGGQYYFWWRPQTNDMQKKHVYNYNKTNIITSYADRILCYTSGRLKKGGSDELVEEATLLSSTTLWETMNGSNINSEIVTNEGGLPYYYLKLTNPTKNVPLIYNSGYADSALEKGEHFVVSLKTEEAADMILYLFDGQPEKNENGKYTNLIQSETFSSSVGYNCFDESYIITVKQRVVNPYFAFGYTETYANDKTRIIINGVFMYKFVGANEKIDRNFKEWISMQPGYCNKISTIPLEFLNNIVDANTVIDFSNNSCTIDGVGMNIWLPVGSMAQNDFKNGTEVYCLEFTRNGMYYDIYPNFEQEDIVVDLIKLTSVNADKRRAISGSRSNRYSLLEEVSKTFFCFTKFVIEYDKNGYIKLDEEGHPKKYFTYVSELGRKNFNGFNYGVNLEEVERKIVSRELVTKVYVESLDNEYADSGLISIQNASYNSMGESFFYNFSYYARQGFFNNNQFMKDYKAMTEFVGLKNSQAKKLNESYIAKKQYRDTLQTSYDTNIMLLSANAKECTKELDLLKWELFKEYTQKTLGISDELYTYPSISFETIATGIKNKFKLSENEIKNKNSYEIIAYFMWKERVDPSSLDQSKAWLGNGTDEANIALSLRAIDIKQTDYVNTRDTSKKQRAELDIKNEEVTKLLEEYNKLLKEKNNCISSFEKKYHRFILEGTWSGDDYIDANTYYLDATRAMATSCMPKVLYSMSVIDLLKVCNPFNPDDFSWGEAFTFDVGDTTYIKDEEMFGTLEQKSMISEITSHIDLPKPDDLTLTNFETRFEELFQAIAAAVVTVQMNENIYSRAENFTPEGAIDVSILQKSFDTNKNLVISSSNNSVVQDNRGITIKSNDNSGQVLRAIAGGIFLSNDNGNTFTAGLTASGFNASLITAGQIDTSKIVVRSSEVPQYTLDSLGLSAYSTESVADDPSKRKDGLIRFDQYGIYATEQGSLFGTNWWRGQNGEEYRYSEPHEQWYNLNYLDSDTTIYSHGTGRENWPLAFDEINNAFDKWEVAMYITTKEEAESELVRQYYIHTDGYDGNSYKWGEDYEWFEPYNQNNIHNRDDWRYDAYIVVKNVLTSEGWFIVIIDTSYTNIEYGNTGTNSGWDGDIKVNWYGKKQKIAYSTAAKYIEENSMFSLTRNGLTINSKALSESEYKGFVKISTRKPVLEVYSSDDRGNDTLRVALGFLRYDNGKAIHGLEVHDGAITVYTNNQKALYFDGTNLNLSGTIITKRGNIAGWTISDTSLTCGNGQTQTIIRSGVSDLNPKFIQAKREGLEYFSVGCAIDKNDGTVSGGYFPSFKIGNLCEEKYGDHGNRFGFRLINKNGQAFGNLYLYINSEFQAYFGDANGNQIMYIGYINK